MKFISRENKSELLLRKNNTDGMICQRYLQFVYNFCADFRFGSDVIRALLAQL